MQLSFGNYYSGHSLLHRLDPRVKLVFSLLLMCVIFFLNSIASMLAYACFLLFLVFLSKIPLFKLLRSLKPVFFIMLFAFVLNIFIAPGEPLLKWYFLSITKEGLILGLRLTLRLSYLVLTTSLLLTLVTTPIAIADALERLCKPFTRFGFPAHEMAMMMSIALRFVPILAQEADKIMKAQSSRGADFDTGNVFQRIKGMVTVLVPLFIGAFQRAQDLALAMEARCYQGGEGRTKLRQLHFVRHDYLATFVGLFLIFLFLFLEYSPWFI